MDNSIRKNEICIIGLPRCDFVFSSTRSCFIAYGYEESPLEMDILKDILENRGLDTVEASGSLSPAQNAFCAKICSKIITSQFCIILLNNHEDGEMEIPNANVNMEYGLMLGFNKYVIPFQRKKQKLPFNVAGLDTIKYSDSDFKRLATKAIGQAIEATKQPSTKELYIDQILETFVLSKEATISDITDQGEKALFNLGRPIGFNLLNDFSGLKYIYFGSFTNLRLDVILLRTKLLEKAVNQRIKSLPDREKLGFFTSKQLKPLTELLQKIEFWIVVNTEDDKHKLTEQLGKSPLQFKSIVFSLTEVKAEVEKIST